MRTLCRELSHGHFSDDNQKRLIGADIPVPIFEAKMTRDSRLVVGIVLCLTYLQSHLRYSSIKLIVSRTLRVK